MTKQEKFLYYFGAGARVNCLPLARSVNHPDDSNFISGLSYSLQNFSLTDLGKALKVPYTTEWLRPIAQRFHSLGSKGIEFGDVDTYAKYLHLTKPGGVELKEVKRTLADYLAIKQIALKARDYRYLPWLVSLMDEMKFPDNVKILSWNYDFQIQLAFEQISELEDISYSENTFSHKSSLLKYLPSLDPTFSDYSSVSLIHLNGIAGYVHGSHLGLESAFQKDKKSITDVLSLIDSHPDKTLIHFAWEKSKYHTELLEHIRNMIQDTTILVVIGYSFPFFNRDIDKVVFDVLKASNLVKKVYYQDPVLNGTHLKSQFGIDTNVEIEHIKRLDNFHVPFEF